MIVWDSYWNTVQKGPLKGPYLTLGHLNKLFLCVCHKNRRKAKPTF